MTLVGQILIANKTQLSLFKGDITERNVDAIVNAANSYLSNGGGVACRRSYCEKRWPNYSK
jgi:hypothetical protein